MRPTLVPCLSMIGWMPDTIRGAIGALVLALLVVAPAARAADGWVILHAGVQAGKSPSHVRNEMLKLGFTRFQTSRAQPLEDYAFGGAELWPAEYSARICPQGKRHHALPGMLQTAERYIASWDYEGALDALTPVAEELECVAEPVDGPTLAWAMLLLGYARFECDQHEAAAEAFRQAAAFDPGVAWDEDYPPDAQRIFRSAMDEALTVAEARVQVLDSFEAHPEIRLDGGPFPGDGAVTPGLHRLTVRRGEDEEITLVVPLEPAGTVSLVPVEGMVRTFLAGESLTNAAADALADALAWTGAAEAYVAAVEQDQVLRFHAETGELRSVQGPPEGAAVAAAVRATPVVSRAPRVDDPVRRQRIAGAIVLGAGGATTAAGLVMHGQSYTMGLEETERARYEWERDTNVAGFVIGMAGVGVAVAGLILLVEPGLRTSRVAMVPGPVTRMSVRF